MPSISFGNMLAIFSTLLSFVGTVIALLAMHTLNVERLTRIETTLQHIASWWEKQLNPAPPPADSGRVRPTGWGREDS